MFNADRFMAIGNFMIGKSVLKIVPNLEIKLVQIQLHFMEEKNAMEYQQKRDFASQMIVLTNIVMNFQTTLKEISQNFKH